MKLVTLLTLLKTLNVSVYEKANANPTQTTVRKLKTATIPENYHVWDEDGCFGGSCQWESGPVVQTDTFLPVFNVVLLSKSLCLQNDQSMRKIW